MDRASHHSPGLLSVRTLVTVFCFVLLVLLAAATVAPLWAQKDWRLDGLSHFRMEYFAGLGLLGLFLLVTRRPVLLVLTLVFLGWNGVEVFRIPKGGAAPGRSVYKAASFNIHTQNRDFDRIVEWVKQEDPDIFVMVEATDSMLPLYNELDRLYPQKKRRSMGRSGLGAVIYSRYPVVDEKFAWGGVGTVPARVELPEGTVTLVVMHPPAPDSKDAWGWRNHALGDLAKLCASQTGAVIALGDMNCSPWSPFFQKFERESGLRSPNVRWLPRRTWPAGMPLIWTQIDQFFVSAQIRPVAEWTGPELGSDHYPIVMTFQFEP
ncbi:endonuclease/exonuclease/phosphatase family protein [Ruficoccus amylovorans]|uniref:Endonuclease/exonuclease/phosphatase family protein n=1 Tax=Ruficoccus amylovorans TaxID=1804625 RepID=A0A842HH48_9BACT|nr:endonuclease/exonuclease/phosphatase family protein [Ruficoccus amylovorans]MBC2595500.1 endonuclease/exonuclease/phosphatase family protein [Ruficoccus amylovorans]